MSKIDWVTIDTTSGASGETIVNIMPDFNLTSSDRSMMLKVSTGLNGIEKDVNIFQSSIPDNVIVYKASEKLPEWSGTTNPPFNSSYLMLNNFTPKLASSGHSFSNGIGILTFDSPVTKVGDTLLYYSISCAAFLKCHNVTEIVFPKSVTDFTSFAVSEAAITSIEIPDSTQRLGTQAFYGCSGVTSLKIGSGLRYIDENSAFNSCNNLETITVSPNNQFYNDGDGSNCLISGTTIVLGAKNSVIPSGITIIYNNAFYQRYSGPLTLNNCESIRNYAFGSSNVTILSTDAIDIWEGAFRGCENLTSVNLSRCVSLGNYAFGECTGLASLTLPNSLGNIGTYCFENCTGLASIVIPDRVGTIDLRTFRGCTSLTSVTIGSGVSRLTTYAFEGCTNLNDINYNGTMSQWSQITKDTYWAYTVPATVVHCTDGDVPI